MQNNNNDMKKIIYILLFSLLSFSMFSCMDEVDPENKIVDALPNKGEKYYENLREYKKSDHQVAFGWFGGWSADSPSMGPRLSSIPDSVDIISIWGKYWGISDSLCRKNSLKYYFREFFIDLAVCRILLAIFQVISEGLEPLLY